MCLQFLYMYLYFALTSYSSWDMSDSGYVAAILDLWRLLTSDSSSQSVIEWLDADNMDKAVGISMLSCQLITYFKFTWRHLGFSTPGFSPFGRTTLQPFPLDSGSLKSKMAAWNTYISGCIQDSNAIPTAISMFSGSSYPMGVLAMLYDQTGRNREWKIQDGAM